ncbi:uncharacterized protein A4U43_C03F18880 [Asparagus officinalis]|uniref:Late embryogenesis abundant protein LEA-2 subgroup domain-containing protein n=1 Tax=Asparagus officinalis TaxID=4686 RepID=A0A5P1FB84_ASPOF|nr:uncharacterized protein LOC109832263 [Asparagus officinalis]ONK75628.1 uncharacterized protein A4U43_C03F18880 [Asparagus officinalis]
MPRVSFGDSSPEPHLFNKKVQYVGDRSQGPYGPYEDRHTPPPGLFGDKARHPDYGPGQYQPPVDPSSSQPGPLGDNAHHDERTQPHANNGESFHNQTTREPKRDANGPYRYPPMTAPTVRRTSPWAWIAAVLCAILWAIIFIGGLTILIVYLFFRPKSPKFEISSVTLNGAYLDAGALLNADLTILANFTNPNRKIAVTFRYVAIDLYFKGTMIATQGIDRFSERAGESTLRSIHMVSSEVALSTNQAEEWSRETGARDGVKMEVKGSFVAVSDFVGTFLRLSYGLRGHCDIAVTGPPSGVLLSSNCTTKRTSL